MGEQWWCSRLRRSGLVACLNVLEESGDDVGIFDAGNHSELAATLRADLDVYSEDAFQALHPAHRREGLVGLWFLGVASRHDGLAVFTVWREQTVEPAEVEPWTRHQCRQAGDEVE